MGVLVRACFVLAVVVCTPLLYGAQPVGDYVLGGHGAVLATFDGAGGFTGVAGLDNIGVVNITGTAVVDASNKISGSFTITNQRTGANIQTSTLTGVAGSGNSTIKLKLNLSPAQTFSGKIRSGTEPVPAGLYFGTYLPTSLLFQFDRSINRQVVTIQGDQDFGLDLNQATAGQLVFDQNGNGFGVVYENGDPTQQPRRATAHYVPVQDKLVLTIYKNLFYSKNKKSVILAGAGSGGNYDGVYTLKAIPGTAADTVSVSTKLTIKNGAITGSDTAFGNITGTVTDTGTVSFTSDKMTVPAGSSQAGNHNGTVVYTGSAANNPVFPVVMAGTFTGPNLSGTFTLEQVSGVTNTTLPGQVPRAETWSGTMTGEHKSPIAEGGVFGEDATISFTFASSLIAALRGKTQLLAGTGNFSDTESIKTQAPFPTAVSAIVAGSGSGSVDVTFAGVLNGPGPTIEFSSSSVLIPGQVNLFAGPNKGTSQFENRKVLKLRVSSMTATLIKGAWQDGEFILRKQ